MYLNNYSGLQISFQAAFHNSVEVSGMSAGHKGVMCGHTIPFVLSQFVKTAGENSL